MRSISDGVGKSGGVKAPWRLFQLAMAIFVYLPDAQAAEPVTISFSQATKVPIQKGWIWKVKAPTGSQIVVTAKPEFFKQSKAITLKYGTNQEGSGWHESLFAPGSTSLTLNAKGVAAAPLKFNVSTQWSVMACYSWKPPGSSQKTDSCSAVVYFEGVDPLKEGANKLISFFFHPPSGVSAKEPNAVAVKPSGQELKLRAPKDLLMRSTTKKFRLLWISGGTASLPASEKQPPGQVAFSFTGDQKLGVAKIDMEGNDWGEITVPLDFGPHKSKLNWTLKACTEVDWSGEICSITRQIELVQTPVIKMSDQFKDPKVDPNQPLPPLPPPPSGGGGGGGGKGNMMAPPPVLSAPAAGISAPTAPTPQGSPPAPAMAPASPEAGRTAPAAGVPGCTPIAGAPGQYACATREAHTGCERLRVAGAAGIRACTAGSEGGRR